MSTFASLANDPEFKIRWPYIWSKIEPVLLQKQRDYARANKGKHEQVGQFVEFMSDLMDELNGIDSQISAPEKVLRKRLHNTDLRQ